MRDWSGVSSNSCAWSNFGTDPTIADLADEDIRILVTSRRVRVGTDGVVDWTHRAGHLERGAVIPVL